MATKGEKGAQGKEAREKVGGLQEAKEKEVVGKAAVGKSPGRVGREEEVQGEKASTVSEVAGARGGTAGNNGVDGEVGGGDADDDDSFLGEAEDAGDAEFDEDWGEDEDVEVAKTLWTAG